MLDSSTIWVVIVGMALGNFALRYIPLSLVSRMTLPRPVLRWLSYIPISVMGALVATEVLRPGNEWQAPLGNPGLYAALLTMLIFRVSKSFLGATVSGMISFITLRSLIG